MKLYPVIKLTNWRRFLSVRPRVDDQIANIVKGVCMWIRNQRWPCDDATLSWIRGESVKGDVNLCLFCCVLELPYVCEIYIIHWAEWVYIGNILWVRPEVVICSKTHCLINMTKGTRKILVVSLLLFVQKCCCSQWQQKDSDKLELHSLRLQLSSVLGHQNHCQEMGKFELLKTDLGVIRIAYFYDQRNNSPSSRPLGEKPHQCHSVQNKDIIRVFHTELCKTNIPILCSLWLKYTFCLLLFFLL